MITVQKNIPMPKVQPRGKSGCKPARYPWHTMEIGDSFRFPPNIGRQSYAAAIQASKNEKKFKVVSMGTHFRCWRIA